MDDNISVSLPAEILVFLLLKEFDKTTKKWYYK